jgi:4-hydroxybenzoate polyprenyltransferase
MAVVALTTSIWTPGLPARLGLATLVFTVASCVVYVGNDVADRRLDRLHPVKRHRPVAAGRIGVSTALGMLAVLLAALVVLVATVMPALWWPVSAYLAINVAYNGGLRHVPLVDAFVVAIGFQVRLVGGYLAVDNRPSQWLMTAVLAVCLVLVLGKRRHELVIDGPEARPVLRRYTVHLIDQMMIICMVVAIVTSLLFLWLDAPLGSFAVQAAPICAPFVLFGLFRYLQVLVVERGGADPVRVLLRDRALLACLGGFAFIYVVALLAAHHPQPSMESHLR